MDNFNYMNFNFKKVFLIAGIIVALAVMFAVGIWVGANKIAYYVPQPSTIDFSLFWPFLCGLFATLDKII